MKVIIIGAGPQALFMLKLYAGTSKTIELACIGKKVATYSNIPSKVYEFSAKECLAAFIIDHSGDWDLIIFAGGFELQSVLDIAPEIFDRDNVQPNKLAALRMFTSKKITYKHAESLNISTLPSAKLQSIYTTDIHFDGPYVLKWDEENTNPKYNQFKTKVFNRIEELICFSKKFDEEAICKLIIQKFLQVDKGCNVSYLGYYVQGKHSFGMLGQQLLQYPVGITAHLIEYEGRSKTELIESAIKLIESVGLEGFCEVEFLLDSKTNQYYLLEVNPRPCGWSSALLGKYQNIASIVSGGDINQIIENSKVEWVNILRYLKGSLDKGIGHFFKALINIPLVKCYDIFSIKDIKPFFSQLKAKK
jgi:predicted ATP-grasp superfamily ATP-dependent carboligase